MKKESFWKKPGVQAVLASLICILLGVLIGYIALLLINPKGAGNGILDILRNWANYSKPNQRIKYFGSTIIKTAPLLMCALSINFCYKVGLFNIGAAGQYVAGTIGCLYAALAWHWNWFGCMLFAMALGALVGIVSGLLKAHLNVNEVISGIMLNWISLYLANTILTGVKEDSSPYTLVLSMYSPGSMLPSGGLNKLFHNDYATIALPLSLLIAILIQIVMTKTKFGYELQATGFNKDAAKYAGMQEKKNTVITLAIGGALAGLGAAFLYLTGFEQYSCTQSSVPAMGFNGIAATFLGGLNPIGTIFSSYFIQHITDGGAYLDRALYPSQISDLISAIIVYLCGFVMLIKTIMNQPKKKKGAK